MGSPGDPGRFVGVEGMKRGTFLSVADSVQQIPPLRFGEMQPWQVWSKNYLFMKIYFLFHLNSSLRPAEILKQHGVDITLQQRVWPLF